MRRSTRRAALLLGLALPLACASSRVPFEELPETPIAVAYWDQDTARKRLEALSEQSAPAAREGVARLENLGRLLGAEPSRRAIAQETRFPGRLCLVYPRTREVRRVEAAPPGSRPLAWSDDRRRLLFSSDRGRQGHQVYEYDLDRDVVRLVTTARHSHSEAAFGPDDRVAFFAWDRSGDFAPSVYTAGRRGASPELAFQGEVVEDLEWTPDGATLIYARVVPRPGRDREPMREIVARSISLAGDAQSTDAPVEALAPGRSPSLSPGGEWIVYSAPLRGGAGWRLGRMRVDGSSRTAVGGSKARSEFEPTVSPDGDFVAYTGDDEGFSRLFVRRFDGTGDRILLSEGAVAAPTW